MTVVYILVFILAYLCGSIPSAYLIGKSLGGIDIRKSGSGNVGSTNALRSLGFKGGLIVFFMDAVKGFLPAYLGTWLGGDIIGFCLGLTAIVGHIFPVWLHFKGGKGVATSFGVLLAVVPASAMIGISTCLIVATITGYVSLGSILAAISIPVTLGLIYHNWQLLLLSLTLVILVIYKHKTNIKRLLANEESRIYTRKTG